jgi:hypothetical protein
MSQFHETRAGQKFLSQDFPRCVEAIERVAKALEEHNSIMSCIKDIEPDDTDDHDIPLGHPDILGMKES